MDSRSIEIFYEKTVGRLENAGFHAAKILAIVMMVLVVANSIGRYVFNSPLTGTVYVVEQFLMVGFVFLSVAKLQSEGSNVAVQLVANKISKRIRATYHLLVRPSIIIGLVLIALGSWQETWDYWLSGGGGAGPLSIPLWISWITVPVGLSLLCLRLLQQSTIDLGIVLGKIPSDRLVIAKQGYRTDDKEL